MYYEINSKNYRSFFLFLTANLKAQTNMESKRANNDESKVLTVIRQLATLMIARDTVAMNIVLDEHYTLTHITGYVQPKAEWFAEVARESMKYYSAKEVNHSIKINGNRADVMVQNMVDARIWGSRNTWRLQQTMQLEKRNGNWIILNSIATTF